MESHCDAREPERSFDQLPFFPRVAQMPAATFLWLPLSVWRDSWGILPLKECKTQGCRLLRRRRGETNTYPIFYNLLVLKRRGEVLKRGGEVRRLWRVL